MTDSPNSTSPTPEPPTAQLPPEPPTTELRPEPAPAPRGVHAMAIFRWGLVLVMAVVAVGSVAYSFDMLPTKSASVALYHCPMHPQVVQDHPGECSICSMTLVRFDAAPEATDKGKQPSKPDSHEGHRHNPADAYACPMHPEETGVDAAARCPLCGMHLEKRDPKAQAAPEPTAQQGVPGLVPVELSLDRVQLIGIRTEQAKSGALLSELKTVGFVSADEARLARVHARFSGWIERLTVNTTGQKVARGQELAALYNLELLPAQQEFLAARRWAKAADSHGKDPHAVPVNNMEEDARARLELFGLSKAEIDGIAKTGKPTRTVAVAAPISGWVTRKNAVQGTYVQPGSELFEIADNPWSESPDEDEIRSIW